MNLHLSPGFTAGCTASQGFFSWSHTVQPSKKLLLTSPSCFHHQMMHCFCQLSLPNIHGRKSLHSCKMFPLSPCLDIVWEDSYVRASSREQTALQPLQFSLGLQTKPIFAGISSWGSGMDCSECGRFHSPRYRSYLEGTGWVPHCCVPHCCVQMCQARCQYSASLAETRCHII